ncbi:MAG: hypothetical protein IJ527_03650 [Prevotella sp.]|nr:hypothetical protein [Prevotella sp.]
MTHHLTLTVLLTLASITATHAQHDSTSATWHDTLSINEVEVHDSEPAWIRSKLKDVLRMKEERYQRYPMRMSYEYHVRYDTCMPRYAFTSRGLMALPSLRQLRKDSLLHISTVDNVICSADSSAQTDFQKMQIMGYEHFICTFDKGFIRTHHFRQKTPIPSQPSDTVELVFWSKKYQDDHGTLLLDTARCEIVSATRQTGPNANEHEHINPIVRTLLRVMYGLSWDYWDITETTTYRRIGSFLYPEHITCDTYERRTIGEHTGTWNFHSSMTLRPSTAEPPTAFIEVEPYVWSAIIYIENKARLRRKQALLNVKRRYETEKDSSLYHEP